VKKTRSRALETLRNCCERPEERAMDLEDFIIAVFCVVDEAVPAATGGQRLRERVRSPS
jgi:hypothetical protein